ncbi:MAG: PIG-L deacetylase family protein [Ktedonobacteraceae bacterium]
MQLKSFDEITRVHRHIFLSPHFDDAVFSCGGTLGVQVSNGLRPLVITIFGGIPAADLTISPFAQQNNRQMAGGQIISTPALVERRRQEDASALDFLHCDYLWLDYHDAIYRGSPAYYTSNEQLIGGEVHSSDLWIDRQLSEDLLALQQRLPDTVWYAPLGIGRHVDHQIVSSAADRLTQQGAKVKLYEDFPYALREQALEARMQEFGGILEPNFVEMSEMLPLRLEASDMYASQIQVNFGGQATMHNTMKSYTHNIRPVQTVHLERFWSPV